MLVAARFAKPIEFAKNILMLILWDPHSRIPYFDAQLFATVVVPQRMAEPQQAVLVAGGHTVGDLDEPLPALPERPAVPR